MTTSAHTRGPWRHDRRAIAAAASASTQNTTESEGA